MLFRYSTLYILAVKSFLENFEGLIENIINVFESMWSYPSLYQHISLNE
jgi:hypothetical protein